MSDKDKQLYEDLIEQARVLAHDDHRSAIAITLTVSILSALHRIADALAAKETP